MGDTAIRNGILDGLQALGGDYAKYGQRNVAVVGTHAHSGPGAWMNYFLPQVTTLGFSPESYQAIVDGTLLSIKRAHDSMTAGTLAYGQTRIEDANANRSPFAFQQNPQAERDALGSDVEKTLTMLRFRRSSDNKDIGYLTWFAVHGTSMLGNNTIVTGDNKGVAADLAERALGSGFVAGFSQANVGDTTPNINGAFCEGGPDDGKMCSYERSLCGGKNEPCHGRGPFYGLNDGGAKSCYEIGRRQFAAAQQLLSSGSFTPVSGAVRSLHTFQDMSSYSFKLDNGTQVTTCSAALGYGFAAGTTDGPGEFDFKQNSTHRMDASPLWQLASGAIHQPSREQEACQAPKPILFDAGATLVPYQWAPNIVDIQLLRVGNFIMIISPGEATTIAGLRWKAAIAKKAQSLNIGGPNPMVVLGAPANSYSHYIATPEEYNAQRYEGASTLYGRWTLPAYIARSTEILPYLGDTAPSTPLTPGPTPPDNRKKSLNFNGPVVYDTPGIGKKFGAVIMQPQGSYAAAGGNTIARVVFVGANPRNNFRLEGTFAAVQKQEGSAPSGWRTVKDDSNWDLVYEWRRLDTVLGTSQVTLSWEVPADTPAGTYRFLYNGDSKGVGGIKSFSGTSASFTVT